MNAFSRSIVAGSTALAVSFGGVVATAEPAYEDYATRDSTSDGVYALQLLGKASENGGWGAMPDTKGAGKMAAGSIQDLGMNGEEAWNATQAGWSLVWIALSLLGCRRNLHRRPERRTHQVNHQALKGAYAPFFMRNYSTLEIIFCIDEIITK